MCEVGDFLLSSKKYIYTGILCWNKSLIFLKGEGECFGCGSSFYLWKLPSFYM